MRSNAASATIANMTATISARAFAMVSVRCRTLTTRRLLVVIEVEMASVLNCGRFPPA